MTQKELDACMGLIQSLWPESGLTQAQMDEISGAIRSRDFPPVDAAIRQHYRQSRWKRPQLPDLLALANTIAGSERVAYRREQGDFWDMQRRRLGLSHTYGRHEVCVAHNRAIANEIRHRLGDSSLAQSNLVINGGNMLFELLLMGIDEQVARCIVAETYDVELPPAKPPTRLVENFARRKCGMPLLPRENEPKPKPTRDPQPLIEILREINTP